MEEAWQDLSVVQVDRGFQPLVEEIPSWRQFPADGWLACSRFAYGGVRQGRMLEIGPWKIYVALDFRVDSEEV